MRFIGGLSESAAIIATIKQKQLKAQPATNRNPHIVEYQCGSSVITQSIAAKLTTSTKKTIVGPENFVESPKNLAESS